MNLVPVTGVSRNPLIGLRTGDMVPVHIGVTVGSLAPIAEGDLVCRFNGEWLLREHWVEVTKPGDVIEWHDVPRGREAVRLLLQVATVVSMFFPATQFLTPYLAAASLAYNVLVPPRQAQAPNNAAEQPGSVFSTSLAGNAARLDQPIWRNCGRVKVTPPFAAQPYVEFVASNVDHPTKNCDQYYYVIFALGIGEYEVEKALIGKTSITHFSDVKVAKYLAPGVAPTLALANVVTSDEVSGLELKADGPPTYVGGYAACRPGDKATAIGIDVGASQGLGIFGTDPITVTWRVEIREIDDFGSPLGPWQLLASESRTDATNTAQRWTNKYTLTAPIRPEIRLVRSNAKNTSPDVRDGIQWGGMRAYLVKPAPLNPHTAHYEVVMRASEQLSGYSQRDFSMILRSKVRTWTPGGGWGPAIFTRNAAWWLADLWTNTVWGEGLPDSRVDLQGLYDWSVKLDARQDRFDYSIAASKDSWAVAQLIARTGRARAFRRGGVCTIARDELTDLPVTAFTARNTQPDSMKMKATLPTREQPDGVVIEYQSNVTWDLAHIECPCPGYTVSNTDDPRYNPFLPAMSRPVYFNVEGITGAMHAEREGLYQAASMAIRTCSVMAKVEMEGTLVAFMDPIRWQPQLTGYGQCGDVAHWNATTLVMGLSEPPDFTGDPPYLTLQRDDGSLTTPVAVTPGPTAWDVILPAAPDFTLSLYDGTRERPKFILGPLATGDELVKISSISDGGKSDGGAQLYDIEAVIDSDLVHLRDNALLPGPGDIQDPINSGADDGGGGNLILVGLSDLDLEWGYSNGTDDAHAGFHLGNNGKAWQRTGYAPFGAGTITYFPEQWMVFQPIEPAVIALYEVRASVLSGAPTSGSPVETWLNLGTSRSWGLDDGADGSFVLRVEIRLASTGVVQESRTIKITVYGYDVPNDSTGGE